MEDIIELLKNNALFEGLTEAEIQNIAVAAEERPFAKGEFILHEGDSAHKELYLIRNGQVEVLKKTQEEKDEKAYCVATLSTGETIGELAFLEGSKRIASVRALTDSRILVIPMTLLSNLKSFEENERMLVEQLADIRSVLNTQSSNMKLALNLSKQLSKRLFDTNLVSAEALKSKLHLNQLRLDSGTFFLVLLNIMVLYSYSLAFIEKLSKQMNTTILAVPIILSFFGGVLYFMKKTGYPAAFFGFSFENWKRNMLEAVIFTIPLIVSLIGLKWYLIYLYGLDIPIFEGGWKYLMHSTSLVGYYISTIAYIAMAPMQEIVARGACQSFLSHFLSGKNKNLIAILVSNLIFSMVHLHLSIQIALFVFIYGLFWGALYARQGTLVGCTTSHIIVGVFVFNIISFGGIVV